MELLIVIGILGILAAGLLAAIDPLEQLKKGRDQQKRSIAVDYSSALSRYYATYGSMPWGALATGPVTLSSVTNSVTASLIQVGELKPTFSQALPGGAGAALSLYADANLDSFVCFDPESKSISQDPSSIFTSSSGTTGAGCPTTSSTSGCYFCAR